MVCKFQKRSMFRSRNSLKPLKHPKSSFAPENFSGHFLARNWNSTTRKPWEFHLESVCLCFEFIFVRNWKKFWNNFAIPHSQGIICLFEFWKSYNFHVGYFSYIDLAWQRFVCVLKYPPLRSFSEWYQGVSQSSTKTKI